MLEQPGKTRKKLEQTESIRITLKKTQELAKITRITKDQLKSETSTKLKRNLQKPAKTRTGWLNK